MKVKTVSYSKSVESTSTFGLKRWDKVGVDIELDEGDRQEDAFAVAKKYVDECLSGVNPGADIHINPEYAHTLNTPPPIIDRKAIEELEIAIDNSQDVAELKGLFDRVQALNNKEVRDFYNKKMSELP